jgi:hypothetical protein
VLMELCCIFLYTYTRIFLSTSACWLFLLWLFPTLKKRRPRPLAVFMTLLFLRLIPTPLSKRFFFSRGILVIRFLIILWCLRFQSQSSNWICIC